MEQYAKPAPYTVQPPPAYNQQQQQQQQYPPPQNVVFVPTNVMWSDSPMQMSCTKCQAQIVTRVVFKTGLLSWLICGGLCIFGCWLGCQFIPFCVDSCKDAEHYCPNCNTLLGVHRKI